MCTVLLTPGVNPIAVNEIYHIISYVFRETTYRMLKTTRMLQYMITDLNIQILCCKDCGFWNEIYNDQRNEQVFNLFIYLLLP
jgi:predicted Zn-ribbon and HTH transcriptional regulator